MLIISTALLLDSNIRNSVCTLVKLPCRRAGGGGLRLIFLSENFFPYFFHIHLNILDKVVSM
jgi:hypothetical protein